MNLIEQELINARRERDAALAERDDARRKSVEWQRLYETQCEMRYASGVELERVRAELAQAREVLRNVEWTPNRDTYGDPMIECPECWREHHEGHAPDCALSAALAKGE